jgi:SAM-dependent methyltransferase
LRADDVASLAHNRLLCALLVRAPVVGASLERLLTAARRNLLDVAQARDFDAAALEFACTLSRQCFINEYVFACDDGESARALALRDEVAAALERGEAVPPQHLALVAAYVPLGSVGGIAAALEHAWPAPVRALLTQQMTEPLDEARRAPAIERLTDIREPVSLRVQRQYEENPYPRWTDVALEAPSISPDAWLRQRLPAASFRAAERRPAPDIRVAGCGTGREAIEMAQRFAAARVLAIDLSRASLAYAARKRDALGVRNVRFAQADIAALESSGDSFDVVSSVGVLHHMADPAAALRTLVARLRPGGFLQIGLYSEPARSHVEAAQRFVAAQGFAPDADGIRRARAALRDADDARRFASVVESPDFYTTSECRDLLFHAHETRFTLLQVRDLLRDAGVRMIGFVLDPRVQARYAAEFPQDPDRTSFERWSAFEARHPDTFIGMYVLWAQKP